MTWRGLAWFWGVVLSALVMCLAVLQWLGPPTDLPPAAIVPSAQQIAEDTGHAAKFAHVPGGIMPPEAKLLEASANFPSTYLPRIAPDGTRPDHAYASPLPQTATDKPRLALLLTGIGDNPVETQAASTQLPPPISFVLSPYVSRLDEMLPEIRDHGHEFLVSIPMQPAGYPVNEEGFRSLLLNAPPADNRLNLEWALTRFQGYVGGTAALGNLLGDAYAQSAPQYGDVLNTLNMRGLLYIDPRPGQPQPPGVRGRTVNAVIQDSPIRADLEAQLAKLEDMARQQGAALGLVAPLRPVSMEWLGDWARGLQARGVQLVPVSALAQDPAPSSPPMPMGAEAPASPPPSGPSK